MPHMELRPQSCAVGVHRYKPEALVMLVLWTLLTCSVPALAGPETTGKWSAKRNWKGTPVHLVLMPVDSTSIAIGDTADALGSILWWRGRAHYPEFEALEGGIQYWSPRTDVSVRISPIVNAQIAPS